MMDLEGAGEGEDVMATAYGTADGINQQPMAKPPPAGSAGFGQPSEEQPMPGDPPTDRAGSPLVDHTCNPLNMAMQFRSQAL